MNDVIDMNERRLQKALKESPVENGRECVQMIGCHGCDSTTFILAADSRVFCANCKCQIAPLRWWDITDRPPAA